MIQTSSVAAAVVTEAAAVGSWAEEAKIRNEALASASDCWAWVRRLDRVGISVVAAAVAAEASAGPTWSADWPSSAAPAAGDADDGAGAAVADTIPGWAPGRCWLRVAPEPTWNWHCAK